MNRNTFNFRIALDSVMVNKLRGMLTALGIVFGVAAVIAMLAIGAGAKKFILDQMKLIGTNNIVIEQRSLEESQGATEGDTEAEISSGNDSKLKAWAPGMNTHDVEAILATAPSVELVSPEIVNKSKAIYNGKILDVRTVGVRNAFFEIIFQIHCHQCLFCIEMKFEGQPFDLGIIQYPFSGEGLPKACPKLLTDQA